MWLLKEYPIITSKKTDHTSNLQKDAAWRSLVEKFNADATIYRSIKQLQHKFNNMKKIARKEMSVEKSGRQLTGGGPPPPKPSETTEWLNTIIGESISGLPAVYDSDALCNTHTNSNSTPVSLAVVIDLLEMENVECNSPSSIENMNTEADVCNDIKETEVDKKNNLVFDTSTPKALLRKPVSKPLLNSYERRTTFTAQATRKRLITHIDNKTDFLSQKKVREGELMKYALEEHMQNMNERNELHAQNMALAQEKHRLYIQQQTELHSLEIEFKRKMNELALVKIKLEIEKLNTK